MEKIINFIAEQKGSISIFLVLVILIVFIFIGVLGDLALLASMKSELASSLQLSSNAALSAYDPELFATFGLFAVADMEEAERRANQVLAEKLNFNRDLDENDNIMVMRATESNIQAVEGMVLANPSVLENQIKKMMDWQVPSLILDGLFKKLDIYSRISEISGPTVKKIAYEKDLYQVQQDLEEIGGNTNDFQENNLLNLQIQEESLLEAYQSQGASVFESQIEISKKKSPVEKIPSLNDQVDPILDYLSLALGLILENTEVKDDSYHLDTEIKKEAQSLLDRAETYYQASLSSMVEAQGASGKTNRGLSGIDEPMSNLDQTYYQWGEEIKRLEDGEISQSMRADYYSAQRPSDGQDLKDLNEILVQAEDLLDQQVVSWSNMEFHGEKLTKRNVDEWMQVLEEAGQLGAASTKKASLAELKTWLKSGLNRSADWSQDLVFSQNLQDTQRSLGQMDTEERSGILEFLNAWNEKRKLKSEVRQAKRENRPPVLGSIYDYGLSSETKAELKSLGQAGNRVEISDLSVQNEQAFVDDSLAQMGQVSSLVQGAQLNTDISSYIYLFAYFQAMFSHRLSPLRVQEDSETGLSLTGQKLEERKLYGGELEYILFGHDDLSKNLDIAQNWISGLRLLSNLIYAFTSSDLQVQTSGLAFALAGWTGFGVPFMQSLLLFILAVGETWLDMQALADGDSLPIIKTPNTWTLSVSGVSNLAELVIEDLYDMAQDEWESGVEALDETLRESLSEISESAIQIIEDTIRNPIDYFSQDIMTRTNLSLEDIEREFDHLLESLGQHSMTGASGQAYATALGDLTGIKTSFCSQLYEIYEKKKDSDGVTEHILDEVHVLVRNMLNPIQEKASQKIAELTDEWTSKAKDIFTSAEEVTKEKINTWLTGYQSDLGGGSLSAEISVAASLTMSYEDYLYLILLMKLSTEGGKNDLLTNAAILMQIELDGIDLLTASTEMEFTVQAYGFLFFLGNEKFSDFSSQSNWEDSKRKRWIFVESRKEGYGTWEEK